MSYHPSIQNVLKFFSFDHLPPLLKEVSKPFYELANKTAAENPDSPETTVALRKLLEAKDAAVRAALERPNSPKVERNTLTVNESLTETARKGASELKPASTKASEIL